MRVVAAGLSFRTAPLAIRERVAIDNAHAATVLRYLVGHAGVNAAAVLSTCNRTEFYLTVPDSESVEDITAGLGQYLDADGTGVAPFLATQLDEDALRHIFEVASGLDSQVIGETQVLGQFKRAHRLALESGCLDPHLDFVLRRARSVARRLQTDKLVGNFDGIAGLATRTVAGHHRRHVVVVGAGETASAVVGLLIREGVEVTVAARGESGRVLASRYGIACVGVDEIDTVAGVDCIVSCTNSPQQVISRDTIEAIKKGDSLLLIDLAVPRDIAPDAGDVDGVSLIDMDSIGGLAQLGAESEQIAQARAIIVAEVDATMTVLRERETAGTAIAALGRWAEQIRDSEVQWTLDRMPNLSLEERERVMSLSRTLVAKMLHNPFAALREAGDDTQLALTLLHAFEVGTNSDQGAESLASAS